MINSYEEPKKKKEGKERREGGGGRGKKQRDHFQGKQKYQLATYNGLSQSITSTAQQQPSQ